MFGEDTVFQFLDLPEGRDWVWMGDANVVVLARRLDCAGRLRALAELQRQWRREHLRVVQTG